MRLVLFADDTNIFHSADNITELLEELHEEMNDIKTWFDSNKLSLNLAKTKVMLFGNQRSSVDVNLCINGIQIERIKETRFLGLIVDEKLSWKPHIQHLVKKISKNIGIIYNTKEFFNKETLKLLYCSFILPFFYYCAEIWGNNYASNIKPLLNIQKRALRLINHASYCEHTNALFVKSKLLKIQDIVCLQTAMMMHRIMYGAGGESLRNLFKSRKVQYNFRLVEQILPAQPKTNRRKFSFAYIGAVTWNRISQDLKRIFAINLFKHKYRSYIFNQYMASNLN